MSRDFGYLPANLRRTLGNVTNPATSKKWLAVAMGGVALMSMGAAIVKNIAIDSFSMVVWRLLLTTVPYGLWLVWSDNRLTWSNVKVAIPGGFFFGFNLLAFYSAVQLTSAANAVVIVALQPIALLLAAGPMFGEWPTKSVIGWTIVAIMGVAISVRSGLVSGTGDLAGDGLAVLAMLSFAAYYLASKKARQQLRTPTYMALMQITALGLLIPVVLVAQGPPTWPSSIDWVWLAAMAVLPGTGHFATNHAHAHLSLSLLGLVGLLAPGTAAVFAWVLTGETLVWLQVVGMCITVAGLAMIVSGDLVRRQLSQLLFRRGPEREPTKVDLRVLKQ